MDDSRRRYGGVRPSRMAYLVSSAMLCLPSFFMIFERCVSMVLMLTPRSVAIFLAERPSARSWRTWRSRSVRATNADERCRGRTADVVLDHGAGDDGAQVGLAGGGDAHRVGELFEGGVLQDVAGRAGMQRRGDEAPVGVNGEDDDPRARRSPR